PSEAYVTLEGQQRKAMADQLATASKSRLLQRIGRLSEDDVEKVEQAIKVQLGLSSSFSEPEAIRQDRVEPARGSLTHMG
ncbi:MAG TPA: type II toxin-antitoxin system PemK/MazF family toxin, partial [Gemmatimonadales bacterium]|nr:type II toxin-antitoxin system PemK/MazF family toxin [Gemmatimonadales bacterium]